ncbi:hypothetical protein GCM10010431_55750 [Streptomyces kunmingensis]
MLGLIASALAETVISTDFRALAQALLQVGHGVEPVACAGHQHDDRSTISRGVAGARDVDLVALDADRPGSREGVPASVMALGNVMAVIPLGARDAI